MSDVTPPHQLPSPPPSQPSSTSEPSTHSEAAVNESQTPPPPPSKPEPEPEPQEELKPEPEPKPESKPEPEPEEPAKVAEAEAGPQEEEAIVAESEKQAPKETGRSFIQPAVSFKEESNLVSDLSDSQRKSLEGFKSLLQQSLSDLPSSSQPTLNEQEQEQPSVSISIWGIPLLKDERTDVVLLKFLRARDFKLQDAFQMLKNTLKWRQDFQIDKLLEQDIDGDLDLEESFGDYLEKVVFMHGHDREGHPVCYNVYGEFQNKELYDITFSTDEKRLKFLRWRIQFLERSIRKLDFRPGGVNTIIQVNDLKNAPGPGKRELRQATRQALHLLQDNYPEFVAKQVFINVPWWYVAFYTMMSPFMTQRTKSKFVFAGPSKTAETLFKYASPEQVPIQYGGLSVDYCECKPEFTVDDPATELNLKSATKQFVEIICSEKCVIIWELRVVGWEVTYSAEFVPTAKDGYTVIIQKATKMAPNDNPVMSGSFKISEVGKIVLTIDNPTFKRRKLLYRYKVLPLSD